MTGESVLHYEIVRKVAEGGMGVVYEARDTRLGRTVAIKMLRPDAADATRRKRLMREARTASALNHPGIVTVHDIGTHDGSDFIVMEYVRGDTLSSRLASSALSRSQALDYACQIARALEAAHTAGIVHRDLKPGNIMITPDERVKVVDFGLARLAPDAPETAPPSEWSISQPGVVVGTPHYMSPEQACGMPVDSRSDIFSFGSILYEMMSGRRAFGRATVAATLHSIVIDTPPPLPDVPACISAVIKRCIEKHAGARFARTAELVAALEAARKDTASASSLIAVLPFENLSSDPENGYFCEGLSEEIILGLSRISSLRVLARTSAFALRSKGDARTAAAGLGVEKLLEGSVRKSGERLRVTADLVNTADGTQIWSSRLDRRLVDVFELQEEIATEVVKALQIEFQSSRAQPLVKRYTEDPGIHNLYMQGKCLAERYGDVGVAAGMAMLDRVIEAEPHHAGAHAAKGIALAHYAHAGVRPPAELAPQAMHHLRIALDADESLPEAWAILGLLHSGYLRDFVSAEKHYRRALEVDSRNAFACSLFATCFLSPLRQHNLALEYGAQACDLDPLSPVHYLRKGWSLVFAGENAAGVEALGQCLNLGPLTFSAYLGSAFGYWNQGKPGECVQACRKAIEVWPDQPESYGWLAYFLGLLGREEEALRQVEHVEAMSSRIYVARLAFAYAFLGIGDLDRAFAEFDRAFDDGEIRLIYLNVFAFPERIRQEPRFQALVRRLKLMEADTLTLTAFPGCA